jgi:hypothetical protein
MTATAGGRAYIFILPLGVKRLNTADHNSPKHSETAYYGRPTGVYIQ